MSKRFFLGALFAIAMACGNQDPRDSVEIVRPASREIAASSTVRVGSVTPDFAFEGLTEDGARATIHLDDYAEPNASSSRLLAVRVMGGVWCGTCDWHAKHTGEVLAIDPRVRVLDLIVGDASNAPARVTDLPAWRASLDDPRVGIAADPDIALRALFGDTGNAMPLYVLIDTRTMIIGGILANPDPTALRIAIRKTLARLNGESPPAPAQETLVDGIFHRNEWDMLQQVTLPGAPPPDPSNAVADDPDAISLGKSLYFDAGLSPSGRVACASCHDPKKGFSDGRARSHGVADGDRNTPSIALAAFSPSQFWDGRADSLWSQALGPIEDAREMGSSRLFVAHRVETTYADAYARAFHESPAQESTTRVFVNTGKAIEAYERTFRVKPNALDAYTDGHFDALTPEEKMGLSVFVAKGCMQCHWGPRLTDDAFHATRMPSARVDGTEDRGREDGIARLASSEFTRVGHYSDDARSAPASASPVNQAILRGAFKTPSLRGVASRAAFGHAGALVHLSDVTELYGHRGLPSSDTRAVGVVEPWLVGFGESSQWALTPFLKTLRAD